MKHIISIGINNTDGLQTLGGAVSGAKDFAKWGDSQGYKTSLFTDDTGIVSRSQIFQAIKKIIDDKTCEKLIIFFSGHGILKSPFQEAWLLSNAKIDPTESVNINESIEYARGSGIPYIVFISDACRVLTSELQLTGNGSPIFPICDDTGQECYIDLLYATRPGSASLEVSSDKGAKKFGLFTQTLLEILNGSYPELIQENTGSSLNTYYDVKLLTADSEYKKLSVGGWFINAINSENSIKSIVADKARKIKITLSQNPEIRILYQNPKPNLSEFDDGSAKKLLISAGNQVKEKIFNDRLIIDGVQENIKFGLETNSIENSSFKSILNGFDSISEHVNMDNIKSNLVKNSEKIFEAKGKRSFETQTGFTIIGAKFKDILLNCRTDVFSEEDKTHVRVYKEDDTFSALLILNNGQSIPIAVLQGYIGTLVFEKGRLLTVNYTPSRNNYEKYSFFEKNEAKIDFVRAFVAGAANGGFDYSKVFENEFRQDGFVNYSDAGSYLRQEKSLDPSLGLYAVYAYMQEGKTKDILSVYDYMRRERDNLIFDVAMLAGQLGENPNRIASFCPMMSLGWAYRHKFLKFSNEAVLAASETLIPNLWTTFDKRGTQIIKELFNEKKIG